MSLAARVSGFFLAALGLVLGGVSVTLYLLASAHLHRDLDERLGLALDVMTTSVDVDPGRVEWNLGARPQFAVAYPNDEPVHWVVSDGLGATVAHTWQAEPADLAALARLAPRTGHSHETYDDRSRRRWRVALRRVHAGASAMGVSETEVASNDSEARSLVLSTVTSLAPLESGLRNVALILTGLSLGFWLLAAALGWWLCKRALLPVTRMAKAAGSMSMADGDQRLPSPGTGDELDLLASSFNGLLDRLHQEFERQKRFAGDASHQLRTPLAALLGQLEVARRRDRTVGEYQRVLDEVHCEAVRLRQIVESLLYMARAESEAGTPELEPIELVLWVSERLRDRAAGERALDIQEHLTTERPAWVSAHPQLLGQLLDNLLDNACKYSPAGTPITVEVGREGEFVTLAVQDKGFGLKAEDLAHVFEPFYRSAEARRHRRPGVGLGLAVVARIAAVFGGTVRVESQPGEGSQFILRLPDATTSIVAPDRTRPPGAIVESRV
jgi:two-component system, OmpR family, sensor kinase